MCWQASARAVGTGEETQDTNLKSLLCYVPCCAAPCARVYACCRRGQVLLATVNDAAMVPFVSQQLNNLDLALSMAKRGNLPGAEGLIGQQFERLFAAGQYKEAAECAAESPQVGCDPEGVGGDVLRCGRVLDAAGQQQSAG